MTDLLTTDRIEHRLDHAAVVARRTRILPPHVPDTGTTIHDDGSVTRILNAPLLRKTLEHIENHPEEWDQTSWVSACGTEFCFAGTALHLAGYEPVYDSEWGEYCGCMASPDEPDVHVDVMTEAIRVLGLDPVTAGYMFEHDRTLGELRDSVRMLTGE